MKPMFKITCMKILIPVLALAGSAAYADPPADKGKPDKTGKTTQLLEDAAAVCAEAGSPTAACNLLDATDGRRLAGPGKCNSDDSGDPNLVYSGRNCDLNEETLLRDAASIVLESYDAMTTSPEQGDNPLPKWCQARASLESYGETFYELTKEGKLTGDSVPEVKELIAKTQWAIDMSLGDYDCSGV